MGVVIRNAVERTYSSGSAGEGVSIREICVDDSLIKYILELGGEDPINIPLSQFAKLAEIIDRIRETPHA